MSKRKRRPRWVYALITLGVILAVWLVLYLVNKPQQSYGFDVASLPEFSGTPYCEINGNKPFFTADDYGTQPFETYSDLDALERCGPAFANLCPDLMPTEARQPISSVIPSGWQYDTYSFIDQEFLYNRCHLIAFMLTGQNANEKNLITGTRFMNVEGMLPFETRIARYIELTGNHVLYRVTPVFVDRNLVASGVELEAWSVEDNGKNICFNVFVYNVQPGIVIDYRTGESRPEN